MNVDVRTYDRNFFKNIKEGETFCYIKEVFMKFSGVISYDGYIFNAVSLNTGRPTEFSDNDLVIAVKTKLVCDEED